MRPSIIILVVEDNPVTLKLMRVALQSEGYTVLTAEDGKTALDLMGQHSPDLIIQDLMLPDIDGFELVRRLRALPGGTAVPIIACSGFLSGIEQARSLRVGFTDYLYKPIEPSRLLETIESHLRARTLETHPGRGRRLLVVDDDPSQLKLLRVRMDQLGFEVATATDGLDALEQIRRSPPHAVLSDVLMPGLDGLRLCLTLRQEPRFDHMPVVLLTAAYTEEEDQSLARKAGADALVLRTPDLTDAVEALLESLKKKSRPVSARPAELPTEEYAQRIIHQLERQVSLNSRISSRLLRRQAEITVLAGFMEAMKETTPPETFLGDLLQRCLNAAGISSGAIFIIQPDRSLSLQAHFGFPDSVRSELPEFFGHGGLLQRVIDGAEARLIESTRTPAAGGEGLLTRAGVKSILVAPIASGVARLGALVMGSTNRDMTEDWIPFAKALGAQIGLVVSVASAHAGRKQAEEELQRQRNALYQTEKVAAMGILLAGVAHELNNPLSVVLGRAKLLSEALGSGSLGVQAKKIAQAADRCGRIVRNFLALARECPPERHEARLNEVVQEAVELLAYPLRVDNVEVRLDLADDLPALWADPHQLHQVVVNLITNAHQAMRETAPPRRLTFTTRYDPARNRVSLAVADTGPGIQPEIQSRIFEPFFTTKAPGQGTGLGLSLCQGIVEGHGGTIGVESSPGQGAVFRIALPVEAPPAAVPEAQAVEAPPIQGRVILVVEDEPEVAEMLADMLSADGHQVETAANGVLALAKLRERAYDLVLSDLKMPELDGPGLYRELERRYPSLLRRVIFLTGDTLSLASREFMAQTGAPTLSKPFSIEEVRQVIRQALLVL